VDRIGSGSAVDKRTVGRPSLAMLGAATEQHTGSSPSAGGAAPTWTFALTMSIVCAHLDSTSRAMVLPAACGSGGARRPLQWLHGGARRAGTTQGHGSAAGSPVRVLTKTCMAAAGAQKGKGDSWWQALKSGWAHVARS
jgi:hypothetical protein